MAGLSKSARYYRNNKKARDKKDSYNSEYHSSPERKKYRAELNRERRRRKLRGNPKDLSHVKSGGLVLEDRHKNRSRNGADGTSTKK